MKARTYIQQGLLLSAIFELYYIAAEGYLKTGCCSPSRPKTQRNDPEKDTDHFDHRCKKNAKYEGSSCEIKGKLHTPDAFGSDLKTLNKFVLVKGGNFVIGTDKPFIPQDGEGPAREIFLADFYINEFEVSNKEFLKFVTEENYSTEVNEISAPSLHT